jgi:hypothetical protein
MKWRNAVCIGVATSAWRGEIAMTEATATTHPSLPESLPQDNRVRRAGPAKRTDGQNIG